MVDVKIPSVGESVVEVEIGRWLKREGEPVAKDETLVTLESDKATLDLPAPAAGVLEKILKRSGDRAGVGEIIAAIDQDAVRVSGVKHPSTARPNGDYRQQPPEAPAAALNNDNKEGLPTAASKAAYRPIIVNAMDDGEETLDNGAAPAAQVAASLRSAAAPPAEVVAAGARGGQPAVRERRERAVPLSPLRRAVARRLVQAQQQAALLTTFNEIEMSALKALRQQEGDRFAAAHGARLGFMSFFVKATIAALKRVPELNGELRGQAMVYHEDYDIGIAVGSGKGLVVPVLRNADQLSFAEVEKAIADFARRAEQNSLTPDELEPGTFTISNGGIYGSLLSTPILNPPQSGILGMHAILDRPIASGGTVAIRPMMYVALTYDHRIVDGREAVTFLRAIKETIESPIRLLMES